jgi:Mg2+-importing ATPase
MLLVPTGAALVSAVLPYTPLAGLLGFTPLPVTFFLLLFGMVVVYLLLVKLAKKRFSRAPHAQSPRPPSTHAERLERHVRRRAARFVHHAVRGSATESNTRPQATPAEPSDVSGGV